MLKYELKKVLVKPVNRIALLILLAALLIITSLAVGGVSYTESDGSSVSGAEAAAKLRQAKEQWAGYVTDNNIAYSRKQGFSDLRELINLAFSGFQSYDYYRADSVSEDEVGSIYERRISNLKEWLDSDEVKDRFTDNEKEYLIRQYEETETPLYYTYADGWSTLLTYSSTLIMVTALIAGFLVSGIFSSEFTLKADSIYFASQYGRNRGVQAKIAAGFILQSGIYWITILLYTGILLLILGAEGGSCAIQSGMDGWKSFYNITYFQEYLFTVLGGYIGSLFILSLAMLVSAKTRSAVLAVTIPFIVLFVPYLSLYAVMLPGMYQVYRKEEVK